jgi:hypothetical protein
MDDLYSGSLKPASNAEVGDNAKYDRKALKGYACESKLKRVMSDNVFDIKEYLFKKFKIPDVIRIRTEAQDEGKPSTYTYEDFDVIEIIKMKLTDFNSKTCIKLWNLYEEKGLISLINAIQYLSPIQKI